MQTAFWITALLLVTDVSFSSGTRTIHSFFSQPSNQWVTSTLVLDWSFIDYWVYDAHMLQKQQQCQLNDCPAIEAEPLNTTGFYRDYNMFAPCLDSHHLLRQQVRKELRSTIGEMLCMFRNYTDCVQHSGGYFYPANPSGSTTDPLCADRLLADAITGEEQPVKILCPTCRTVLTVPRVGFPVNRMVEAIRELYSTQERITEQPLASAEGWQYMFSVLFELLFCCFLPS